MERRAGEPVRRTSAAGTGLRLLVRRRSAPLVSLPVGETAAYSDGVAGVSVLANENAVMAFLHGLFAGDVTLDTC